MKELVRLLRPYQWVKNLFVFLPLFFGQRLTEVSSLTGCVFAFAGFCMVSSAIYCFNDVLDAKEDRSHPTKKRRPVASGTVSVLQAVLLMAFLCVVGFLTVFAGRCGWALAGILALYVVVNILYSIWLKNIAIVDVLVIAAGFVLRIVAGSVAADVVLSHWIVIMTFLLALFLAFAKRRDDLVIYEQTGVVSRKNIVHYNLFYLNAVLVITATVTIVAYIMYTVSPEVIARLGCDCIYLTSIFVITGIFRYLQLTLVDQRSGNPTYILWKDRFIQLTIAGWIGAFLFIIYLK